MRYLLLSLLLITAPVYPWGSCEKREYNDRADERDDRNLERQTWNMVLKNISNTTKCVTTEDLIVREARLQYREEEFERTKQKGINEWKRAARNEFRQELDGCYSSSQNYIEFSGCLDGIGI